MALSLKQKQYAQALKSHKFKYLLYGGGVAGGKTFLTLGILDELCQTYENVRFAIIRKSLATLRRNTIPSYNKLLRTYGDPDRAKLNKTEWTVKYHETGSELIFIEGDVANDPELNKLRGLEVTGCLLEEANECVEDVFNVMLTRIGRWNNEKYGIPAFILLTCNPSQNWVKYRFYEPWREGTLNSPYYFLPALPHDNPYNSKSFLEGLEELPEPDYERYVKGNWDFSSDPNQLIPFQEIKDVLLEETPEFKPLYMGIDVAREGDDSSAIAYFDATRLLRVERYKFDKLNPLKDIVKERVAELGIQGYNIIVDAIGLGAGLIDLLEEEDIFVTSFKSSESPEDIEGVGLSTFTFGNKRAEAHWCLRQCIFDKLLELVNNRDVVRQLPSLKYFAEERCIKIAPKKTIKKELGFSPDVAEAVIMGNYLRVLREGYGGMRIDDDMVKQFGMTTNAHAVLTELLQDQYWNKTLINGKMEY